MTINPEMIRRRGRIATGPFSEMGSPIRLGGLDIPNRIVMAAMSSVLSSEDGRVTDALVGYYKARADGGAGLITVEFSGIDRHSGRAEPRQLMLDQDDLVAGHQRLTEVIRSAGARAAIQLHSPGQYSHPATRSGLAVAPSDQFSRRDASKQLCRALSGDEIQRLIDNFAMAARRAVRAGYEAIEIHGAHGYLPQAFLSPLKNFRDDAWGGDDERRMRFALEAIRVIKGELAPGIPLMYRLSSSEFLPGGLELDDMVRIAPHLVAAGVDVLNVSSGTIDGTLDRAVDPMSMPEGWRFAHCRAIRQATCVPVIGVGPARWPEVAEQALARGDIDMIALGRPLLADPEWPRKALSGEAERIRPCTNCNWCFSRVIHHEPIGCAENPQTGAETDSRALTGGAGRKIIVVGGGPGGMAAALDLAEAGFDTELFEADDRLGGGLIASANPPLKDKLFWYLDHLVDRLSSSPVAVHLGAAVTIAAIVDRKPAAVLLATGAQPAEFAIDGIGLPMVRSAYDLLMTDGDMLLDRDRPIVVYGGGETGCETSEFLAERGFDVVLVTRSSARDLARSAEGMYRKHLIQRLRENRTIAIVEHSRIIRVEPSAILLDGPSGEQRFECGHLVMAQGRKTGSELEASLTAAGIPVKLIGDVEAIGRIGDAVHAGRRAVLDLLGRTEALREGAAVE